MSDKTLMNRRTCKHGKIACINTFEFIRKYRCKSCGAVMMCACDEPFGRRFLSHQLDSGTELETQRCLPVTAGFQPNICRECRGLPAEATPVASIYGRTTKVRRYYWREIFFETTHRFAAWEESGGISPDAAAMRKKIEKEVVAEIHKAHLESPKYDMSEPSAADIIERYGVEVVNLHATYAGDPKKGAVIARDGGVSSAEACAENHFRLLGYEVMKLESVPFHVLSGVFMWLLIQDARDDRQRFVGFGNRTAVDTGVAMPVVYTSLPEDFGAPGYGRRRAHAIKKHLTLIPPDRGEMLWLFDYWLSGSGALRQYLWAHRETDIVRARRLIEILPPETIKRILEYLVASYWKRYLGWPDLLVSKGEEFFFAEVKSSSDKLSDDQKDWIAGNAENLRLPLKLVKIHRASKRT